MGRRTKLLSSWPVLRQMHGDPFGLGRAAQSRRSQEMRPRTDGAERVVRSVCPYCAVGCGQRVFVEEGSIAQIEGDPDSPDLPRSPVSEGLRHSALRDEPATRI